MTVTFAMLAGAALVASARAAPSAGCASGTVALSTPGTRTLLTLQVTTSGGAVVPRQFLLYVPKSATAASPLVLNFHGNPSTASDQCVALELSSST